MEVEKKKDSILVELTIMSKDIGFQEVSMQYVR